MKLSQGKVEALRRRVSLFYGFEDQHIHSLLEYGRLRDLRDGELIISEGTLATRLYLDCRRCDCQSKDDLPMSIFTLPVGSTGGRWGS